MRSRIRRSQPNPQTTCTAGPVRARPDGIAESGTRGQKRAADGHHGVPGIGLARRIKRVRRLGGESSLKSDSSGAPDNHKVEPPCSALDDSTCAFVLSHSAMPGVDECVHDHQRPSVSSGDASVFVKSLLCAHSDNVRDVMTAVMAESRRHACGSVGL